MTKVYAGLDVGETTTAVCVVDSAGEVVFETATDTTPSSIAQVLRPYRRRLKLVGQEAGNTAPWLQQELSRLRFPIISLDALRAHSALRTRLNKTDANDARGLALLLSRGFYTPAHIKSADAMRIRAVLILREAIIRKAMDLNLVVRMVQKRLVGDASHAGKRKPRTESEVAIKATLKSVKASQEALTRERAALDAVVADLAEASAVCQRLMTIPGVGPVVALNFVAAIDDPTRFKSSRVVGAYFGLTPRVFQSGASLRSGGISHRGDPHVRKALYAAAFSLLANSKSNCPLRRWGKRLARTKGNKTAYVAVARKLAVLMHHLWVTGEDFRASRVA